MAERKVVPVYGSQDVREGFYTHRSNHWKRPYVALEATPEGVGPFEEWMVAFLTTATPSLLDIPCRVIEKYGPSLANVRCGIAMTIRRVPDAGKDGGHE